MAPKMWAFRHIFIDRLILHVSYGVKFADRS